MNIYEPAALIADTRWREAHAKNVTAETSQIRSELTAPASEPDLERMQEAYERAVNEWNKDDHYNWHADAAKYLATEGFRLGEPVAVASPKNCTCHPDEAVRPCPRLHAHSECAAHERAIQSRIDEEVREEREAIAENMDARSITEMRIRDIFLRPGPEQNPMMAEALGGRASAFTDAARAVRARIKVAAPTKAPAAKDDVSLGDVSAAGENPAPVRRVVQIAMTDNSLAALCNDGSLWEQCDNGRQWKQLPPIPQPGETT